MTDPMALSSAVILFLSAVLFFIMNVDKLFRPHCVMRDEADKLSDEETKALAHFLTARSHDVDGYAETTRKKLATVVFGNVERIPDVDLMLDRLRDRGLLELSPLRSTSSKGIWRHARLTERGLAALAAR